MKNIYEKWKLYRGNPCDYDAVKPLKHIGKALHELAGDCPCCAGARLLAVALVISFFPNMIWVLLAWAFFLAGVSVMDAIPTRGPWTFIGLLIWIGFITVTTVWAGMKAFSHA